MRYIYTTKRESNEEIHDYYLAIQELNNELSHNYSLVKERLTRKPSPAMVTTALEIENLYFSVAYKANVPRNLSEERLIKILNNFRDVRTEIRSLMHSIK